MDIIPAASHRADLKFSCEAVVIGTGAGGAMMARDLAAAGVKVAALEMGGVHRPADFNQREDAMFERLFQNRGAQATDDLKIRLLTGIGVGGSTVHNTNLCKPTHPDLLARWARDYQVSGNGADDMASAFERTAAELSVTPMGPSELNNNNAVFRRGVEALGYKGAFLDHNRKGCIRSGFCELGCAYDAKQNAAKVLIPKALELGAQVYSGMRAERVLVEKGRAVGVSGSIVDPLTQAARHRFTVECKAVCVAGSALRSPALLQASGIRDAAGLTGKNFRCHPAVIAAGIFDEVIDSWKGIPQSYECTELLDQKDPNKNIWLIPGAAHPIGTAAMAPGFGAEHMRFLRQYRHMAAVIVMVDEDGAGVVRSKGPNRLSIKHRLAQHDRDQLVLGLQAAARILLAAGAREVVIPHFEALVLKDEQQIDAIAARGIPDYDLAMTAVHPMGTLRMGDDPSQAVVDSAGQHHAVKGLFVCDGSIFPTALGGPPQISIYGFARHFAPGVARFIKG